VDYKLDHKCEELKSPKGWAPKFTLSHMQDGKWVVERFFDSDPRLVCRSQDEAKERNRELARNWLSSKDPEGRIFEEAANPITFRHPTTGQVIAHYFQDLNGRATLELSGEKIPLETLLLDVYRGDGRLLGDHSGPGEAWFRDQTGPVVLKIPREFQTEFINISVVDCAPGSGSGRPVDPPLLRVRLTRRSLTTNIRK